MKKSTLLLSLITMFTLGSCDKGTPVIPSLAIDIKQYQESYSLTADDIKLSFGLGFYGEEVPFTTTSNIKVIVYASNSQEDYKYNKDTCIILKTITNFDDDFSFYYDRKGNSYIKHYEDMNIPSTFFDNSLPSCFFGFAIGLTTSLEFTPSQHIAKKISYTVTDNTLTFASLQQVK